MKIKVNGIQIEFLKGDSSLNIEVEPSDIDNNDFSEYQSSNQKKNYVNLGEIKLYLNNQSNYEPEVYSFNGYTYNSKQARDDAEYYYYKKLEEEEDDY